MEGEVPVRAREREEEDEEAATVDLDLLAADLGLVVPRNRNKSDFLT